MYSNRMRFSSLHQLTLRQLTAAILLICTFVTTGAQAQINLKFGLYTTDKPTAMVKAFRPVLSELEEALSDKLQDNVKIRLQVASTYQKGVEALATGKVDFAMLGPASYIETQQLEPGLKILALDSKDGSKTRTGVICVRKDSDIAAISDLEGKRFAFGNERSTVGRYLSQALLTEKGITAKDLESFDYLGRHDSVAHSVAQGRHDAGALKEGTYKKLKSKGLKLRSLATFPLINRPWVARAGLESTLFYALQESMLGLDAPKAFKAMGRKQFIEGTDSDFTAVRAAIENNAEFFAASGQSVASSEKKNF